MIGDVALASNVAVDADATPAVTEYVCEAAVGVLTA
jgi:hypothetical protein